jgi:hypothetical protein
MRALAAVLCASAALASAPPSSRAESPRSMMLELHGGAYTPDVDSEFGGAATPWRDTFGAGSLTLLRMHLDYQLWQAHGSLAVGAGFGYGWIDGFARNEDGDRTDDEVGFNLMPLTASLIYRWDWAAVEHGVPLVPYAKIGLTGAFWWATDAKNDISNTRDGAAGSEAREGNGLTFGWHASVGLMFLLDVFSTSMAIGFDNEFGVNNSYIFVEYQYTSLDDFGSGSSLVLSDATLSFGLAFEF